MEPHGRTPAAGSCYLLADIWAFGSPSGLLELPFPLHKVWNREPPALWWQFRGSTAFRSGGHQLLGRKGSGLSEPGASARFP